MSLGIIALLTLSVLLHVTLGWEWTVGAGIAAGVWYRRNGWLIGMIAVGGAWGLLVGYNFMVAPGATGELARIMSTIMGNLPPVTAVAATVLIGALIGCVGGLLGSLMAASVPRRHVLA